MDADRLFSPGRDSRGCCRGHAHRFSFLSLYGEVRTIVFIVGLRVLRRYRAQQG